jgi:heme/copper-type cytochrome/quinol oxidase subunit 2
MLSSTSEHPAVFLTSSFFLVEFLQAGQALGCAACTGSIPEPIRQAYNISTAWLSFIPLIFMGSVAYFIYRVVKRAQTEEQ